jgi:hypothetical protein
MSRMNIAMSSITARENQERLSAASASSRCAMASVLSVREEGGMLFTVCSYTRWRALGKRENNLFR